MIYPNDRVDSALTTQVLAKRLNGFVKLILIVSSIALIVFLTNVDSGDYREDYEALRTLSELPDISLSAANPKYAFNEWLTQHKPELFKEANDVRISLINELSQYGFSKEKLLEDISSYPAKFSAVDFVFSDHEMEWIERRRSNYTIDKDDARNVKDLIDIFETAYSSRSLAVAGAVTLNEQKIQRISQPRGGSQISEFFTDQKSKQIVVIIKHPEPQGSRAFWSEQEVVYPTELTYVNGPSLAAAMGFESDLGLKLFNNSEHRSRLRKVYRVLDVKSAMSITSEQFVRSYKQVEILGMAFSARRLPLAVSLILSILTACNSLPLMMAINHGAIAILF